MAIKSDDYGQTCVLSLVGDFAGDDPTAARKLVAGAIDDRQVVDFVVDFEKSGFVDSDGLEMLLWLKLRCDDLFGRLKLAGLDENVKKILEVTRLGQRFDLHADAAAALKAMR